MQIFIETSSILVLWHILPSSPGEEKVLLVLYLFLQGADFLNSMIDLIFCVEPGPSILFFVLVI